MRTKSRVKRHFQENWKIYCAIGGTAIFTYAIMRNTRKSSDAKDSIGDTSACVKDSIGDTQVFSFLNNIGPSIGVVNVMEREGRGHPGYLTRCLDDGLAYASQKRAAEAYTLDEKHVSDHILGRREHVNGLHFERIYMAA